ncbi:MAG: FAD-dependent oxidoreductase, partial [Thermoguttaceae bacterium]|nr:FAD-dependent oxidoreductase [Thermoguttaceae bacterium]
LPEADEGWFASGPRAVSGLGLVELMRRQAINFGAEIISEDVVSVDFDRRPFVLHSSDGATTETRTVVVATGASARRLGVPGEERFANNGVSYCSVCDGSLPRFRNRPLVVVGGGDAALDDALYLAKFAEKVYVVHRRDALRGSEILARRAEAEPNIEFVWNSVVKEICGDDANGVQFARLAGANGMESREVVLETSGVFVAIGRSPNVRFLNGALELTEAGYIKKSVPFRTNTSVPGVFAAGDVADEIYRQAIIAAASGAAAAMDAAKFLTEGS